ncbi:Uncharacterised protein [Serratia quinivorans]|nr:Uncharacterised protein [Serratia quinivorans]
MSNGLADKFKIDGGIDFTDQMVFGDQFIKGDGFKLVLLGGRFFEHGGQSVFCTDLIRSKSWPHGQDFVITLSLRMRRLFLCLLRLYSRIV